MGSPSRIIQPPGWLLILCSVAQVVEPPLAAGMDIVGCNETAPGALPAAGAPHPSCKRRVAKPWTEEPDAGNLHVRLHGSLGGAIP
jgi:hypothetical protein